MLSKVDKWKNQVQLTIDVLIEEMIDDNLSAAEIKTVIEEAFPYVLDDLEAVVIDYREELERQKAAFMEGEENDQ